MKKTLLLILLAVSIFSLNSIAQNTNNEKSFQFVFLTDIHVQPERRASEGFEKAIAKVNEINPDFVLTGGDLIMDALNQTKSRADSLYQLYLKLQKEFTMPVYNTPGNHENFGFYKKDEVERSDPDYGIKIYRRYIGQPYYSFDHKGWHFIVLNSVMETDDRRYRGGVSTEEIEWLRKDLNTVDAETPIVVSVHIPLITAMTQIIDGALEPNPEGIVINNSKEVLGLFADKNLKLVLQGHLHYLEDLYMEGKTHFITGGAVSANWWKGPRGNMEEGFLLLTVKGDDFTWEYVDFGWEVAK
ncbi:MAG: metallophosphoesterase [Bacteroidales bacterium]|nr:metallophosphoesterase [Bacteroidales bacterium]